MDDRVRSAKERDEILTGLLTTGEAIEAIAKGAKGPAAKLYFAAAYAPRAAA